ncbi:DNA polymerase kappa-like [Actinia tenebrosa]|uniref:DNA polymerase kappa n=1 Tax=Actinia tenebrosa TaxID=6105 RepID=A0A6P8H1I4_ACTTE|nr:DNA polymerase kappa-like [Actinia tenebrosa]
MAGEVDFEEEFEEEDEFEWNERQTYQDQTITFTSMKTQTDGISNYENFEGAVLQKPKENAESTETFEVEKPETSSLSNENSTGGPSRMSLNDHKAGMEGLDKEKINKIIFEASKGSKFYENELLKEQQVKERIHRQTEQLESSTDKEKSEALVQADRLVKELEETRDLSRTIVHIDMDAFYAAVEMRDDPSLRDKPMAVGSMGMLSTSNYLARRFGVRAAMPGFIGKKLCPDLTIVPGHFDKYREASSIVRNILKDYDPDFLPMSLDEAYLDLTDYIKERQKHTEKRVFYKPTGSQETTNQDSDIQPYEFGHTVDDIVKEIRFRIELETQLTASAGIACNRMLAKVCTDRNKPNGQFILSSDRDFVLQFVRDLPIRKISGIGRVSEQMLKALGITTCSDLYDRRGLIVLLHSNISSRFLIAVSLGLGETRLECTRERKSLGTERTFTEISNPKELFLECQNLCKTVANDCKDEGLRPRTVTLKLKTVKFDLKTRSFSYPNPISSEKEIWDAARDLLSKEIKSCEPKLLRLRLMGVRLSNFESFEKKDTKQDTITSFLQMGKCKQESDGHDGTVLECGNKDEMSTTDLGSASTSGIVQSTSATSSFQAVCPVCNNLQTIEGSDHLEVFNKHVDLCLKNQSEVEKSCFEAVCPVCNTLQVIKNPDYLTVFNKHVDLCLNSGTIKKVLSLDHTANTSPGTPLKKDGGETGSTGGKSMKGGKRKQQNTKDASTPKRVTLERFWSK